MADVCFSNVLVVLSQL